MQLYNTLSAEERAIMIDDSGNKTYFVFLCLCANQDPTQFRNDLFLAWNPLEVLGRIYVANGESTPLSLPADNFYAFKDSIEVCFHERNPIEYCNRATIIPFKIND
jgi:UPF0176 protein